MRASNFLLPMMFSTVYLYGQVLAPPEILDPQMRALQQKYAGELKRIAQTAGNHTFPYRFYFSRALDLSEKEQPVSDQRSIQFDRYKDKVVLKITGNYFAAYSTLLMSPEERARQTYRDVMLPLLEAAAPVLVSAPELQAYAFEISHHVRKKVLGVSSEGVENVVLILPKASAERLVQASIPAAQQAALAEGEIYLNAVLISGPPSADHEALANPSAKPPSLPVPVSLTQPAVAGQTLAKLAVDPVVRRPVPDSPTVADKPDTSPDTIKSIQKRYQDTLDRMVQDLNAQAHFVRYAPPAVIPFHRGLYLQLSLTTTLLPSAAGSQYKLAALAFDQQIAHLIRPVLSYFREDRGEVEGIDFSTSVRLGTDPAAESGSIAVEFIFPLSLLRSYEQFDATGQQLIDAGFVLINGERVSLNLQSAEAQ